MKFLEGLGALRADVDDLKSALAPATGGNAYTYLNVPDEPGGVLVVRASNATSVIGVTDDALLCYKTSSLAAASATSLTCSGDVSAGSLSGRRRPRSLPR